MQGNEPIELDRPRSLSEILTDAARLYRRFPWLFALLALGVIVPWQLAVLRLISCALVLLVGLAPLGDSSGAGSVAAGIALNTVTASFGALTIALLYFDLRARPKAPPPPPREHPHLRDLD